MSARLERLLVALQALEEQQALLRFDELLEQLAGASDHSVMTVQAYFAKGLEGHVIHGGSDGRYFVMGAVGMSPGDLSALLSQKLADGRGIASRAEWSAALRRLAEIGLARGYRANVEDATLMRDAIRENEGER